MNRMMRWTAAATIIGGAGLLGGCGGGGVPNSLEVSMDDSARAMGTTVTLDVVGVNDANLAQWQGKPVGDYFSGSDPMRESARGNTKTLLFTREDSATKTIAKNDPIWGTWRKSASALVLMAQIPTASGTPGADPRRLVLPLEKGKWADRTFKVQITPAGLVNNTKVAPRKD